MSTTEDYLVLVTAGCAGDIETVKQCLASGLIDVNNRDWNKDTIYQSASNSTPLMAMICELVDVTILRSIIMLFLESGYTEFVDTSILIFEMHPPLSDLVLLMIKNGADVEQISLDSRDEDTLLTYLCGSRSSNRNEEYITALISANANVNFVNSEGSSALMQTCAYGSPEIARLLIVAGADIHLPQENWSLLLLALSHENAAIVEFLIKEVSSIDINLTNKFNMTPLQVAVSNVDVGTVKLLIERGCDVNHVSSQGGSFIFLFCDIYEHEPQETYDNDDDDDDEDNNENDDINDVDGNEDDHNVDDEVNRISLLETENIERHARKLAIAEALINAGTDVNAVEIGVDNESCPILRAAYCSVDIVKLLLKSRANWDVKDNEGFTVLHNACIGGQTEAMDIFFKHIETVLAE